MKKLFIPFFLIAVVGLIAYSNTFNFPFVFDDHANITDNPLIKQLDNFIFPAGGYKGYLPRAVGFFTFALNYHFGGLNVTGYHIVNLIIHITNAILIYFFVILTFKTPYFSSQKPVVRSQDEKGSISSVYSLLTTDHSYFIALFSALLFVSHPLQTQAVTYIVQRLTSLATMFYLLSVVMYVKARLFAGDRQVASSPVTYYLLPITYFSLSLISAICAMLTKEISFTIPLVVILYEFTFFKSSIKKKLYFLLPIFLTLIIIPLSIMGTDKPLGELLSDLSEKFRVQTELSRWDYLFTQFRVVVTYIRLLFFPVNQNLDYDYPVYHSFFTPPVFLSFLLLMSIFGIAVYLLYKTRVISGQRSAVSNSSPSAPLNPYFRVAAFGIFWFFITLSVTSSVIPIVDVIFEHRVYLPSVGAFIAVSAVVSIISERLSLKSPQIKKATILICALIVVVLSTAAYARNTVWKDKKTLWEDVVSKSPKNARALNNLGALYYEENMPDMAIKYLSTAIFLKPDYVDAYNNLGLAYYKKGLYYLAKKQFANALRFDPNDAFAFNNFSIVYAAEGLYDRAIEYAQLALKIDPDYAEAHNSLGVAYGSKEMYDLALKQFSRALELKPDYFDAKNNLLVVERRLQTSRKQ